MGASNSKTVAAVNAPDSGIPQGQLDFNHTILWAMRCSRIECHNSEITDQELADWSLRRPLNAQAHDDTSDLFPLTPPQPRLHIPTIPPPPGPGQPLNHPPLFDEPVFEALAPPPDFPATKWDLKNADPALVDEMLEIYRLADEGAGMDHDAKLRLFAHFIGVSL
ncbi:AGC/AKT protein kinase Gad8 [Pseudohyphozyma bogoriensis]|nr:AGC/AKT protein kinase Gad8 [Pseudohyphozyma bogoriensis]